MTFTYEGNKRAKFAYNVWLLASLLYVWPVYMPFYASTALAIKRVLWRVHPLLSTALAYRGVRPRLVCTAAVALSAYTWLVLPVCQSCLVGDDGFLFLCDQWCGQTGAQCVRGVAQAPSRSDAAAGAEDFFAARVFGAPTQTTRFEWRAGALRITAAGASHSLPVTPPSMTLGIDTNIPSRLVERSPYIANAAHLLNDVAAQLRRRNISTSLYGCSINGKIAFWASATAPRGAEHERVLIDSGGTLGPASARHVGACGEPLRALAARYPQWLKTGADTEVARWPFDVGDATARVCAARATDYTIAVGQHDMWNNYLGTLRSVELMRERGCRVSLIVGETEHCGYFVDATASSSAAAPQNRSHS
jgi:hypothetical protein